MFAQRPDSGGCRLDEKLLQAVRELLKVLIETFGAWGTVILTALILIVLFGFRLYKDRRADRAVDRALAEKERSIQRLANQERSWRRIFLTESLKLDGAEADRILGLEGDYEDAEQARKAIEGKKKKK